MLPVPAQPPWTSDLVTVATAPDAVTICPPGFPVAMLFVMVAGAGGAPAAPVVMNAPHPLGAAFPASVQLTSVKAEPFSASIAPPPEGAVLPVMRQFVSEAYPMVVPFVPRRRPPPYALPAVLSRNRQAS